MNSLLDFEPLGFPDSPHDKFENCPTYERRGLNTESKAYKQCIFCDYLLINDNKKYKKEYNFEIYTKNELLYKIDSRNECKVCG